MLVVPGAKPPTNVTPIRQGPKPTPTQIAMAAATMHSQGRLFEDPNASAEPTSGK